MRQLYSPPASDMRYVRDMSFGRDMRYARLRLQEEIYSPPASDMRYARDMHYVRDMSFGRDMRYARLRFAGANRISLRPVGSNITFAKQKYHAEPCEAYNLRCICAHKCSAC